MWIAVVVVVVIIAAAASVLLFAPITIDVSVVKVASGAASAAVRFRWLGLSFGGDGTRPHRRANPPRKPASDRRPRRYGWPSVRAALGSPGFLRRCAEFATAMGRLALPDRLHLQGRVGFEDPDQTGVFLGWMYLTSATASPRRDWIVAIEPEFSGSALEGRAELGWSRRLAAILWPLLTFVASPIVWRAWINASRCARHRSNLVTSESDVSEKS